MHRSRLDATIPMFALCISASCVLRTPTLIARTPSLTAGTSAPPSGSEAAPVDDAQIIEAGCSFTGSDIKGEPGSLHPLQCPAGCDKNVDIAGTDDYTSNSPVCVAAIHAGMISERGGQTTVMLEPGRPAYRGSKRNGVQTHDWGAYRGSYRFQGVPIAPVAQEVAPAPVIVEAGCTLEANDIRGEPGSLHRVSCPAGCNTEAPAAVWGSNPYSGHSRICVAAIHAGLSTNRGGEFTLILEDAKPAFRGSKSNGVESRDWGAYRASFRLRR
jgi:hypothetical protein